MTEKPRVLIAEDENLMRRFYATLLQDLNLDLVLVNDGPSALAQVEECTPALVILDAVMPGMDGFTLCRTLKADPRWSGVPVLISTALKGNAGDRALEAGADDFLPKGLPHTLLLARIHHHLAPPTPRTGPLFVATPDRTLHAQLAVQARREGYPTIFADALADLPVGLATAGLALVDLGFGAEHLRPLLAASDTPTILLFREEDRAHLDEGRLAIQDGLLKPLSALETWRRVRKFLPVPEPPSGSHSPH